MVRFIDLIPRVFCQQPSILFFITQWALSKYTAVLMLYFVADAADVVDDVGPTDAVTDADAATVAVAKGKAGDWTRTNLISYAG